MLAVYNTTTDMKKYMAGKGSYNKERTGVNMAFVSEILKIQPDKDICYLVLTK
jgi:hypothetical protein